MVDDADLQQDRPQIKMYNGTDQTSPDDYHADEGSPKLREVAAA